MDDAAFAELFAQPAIDTPAFVYDEEQMRADIAEVRAALGPDVRLLLAMKAFTVEAGLRAVAPLLDGFHASSLFEARLARSVLGDCGLVHVTTPGLRPEEVGEIAALADHVSFNSLSQWQRFRTLSAPQAGWGLRVNPGISLAKDPRYDPCGPFPRLGVPVDVLADVVARTPAELDGLSGLLVHTNCEGSDVAPLLRIVELLEDRLGLLLNRLRWVDLGGGYLLQFVDDLEPLREAVRRLRVRGLEVVMEPGSALVASAGYLVGSVVDVFCARGQRVAVLDTSVNHAPEVFEYSWSPDVLAAEQAPDDPGGDGVYLLTGSTCLAGDVFGRYRFPAPLTVGARVVFTDLGAYSMVKAHRFNGVNLPTIYALRDGAPVIVRRFTFTDFVAHWGGSSASVRGQLRDNARPGPSAAGSVGAGSEGAVRGVAAADPARGHTVR